MVELWLFRKLGEELQGGSMDMVSGDPSGRLVGMKAWTKDRGSGPRWLLELGWAETVSKGRGCGGESPGRHCHFGERRGRGSRGSPGPGWRRGGPEKGWGEGALRLHI